jgi:hypothetical protein
MTDTKSKERREEPGQDSTWSSPSKLSRKVRELAHRSHRVLHAYPVLPENPAHIGDDLRDLRQQVARLRQKIHERQLAGLISWVDALDQQVNHAPGSLPKAGPR